MNHKELCWMSAKGNAGKNEKNAFCLKIANKSSNSRDNQGKINEIACFCSFKNSISKYAEKVARQQEKPVKYPRENDFLDLLKSLLHNCFRIIFMLFTNKFHTL